MAKKKHGTKKKSAEFDNSPFEHLRGFAVSAPLDEETQSAIPVEKEPAEVERSFSEEMDFLGVTSLEAEALEPKSAPEDLDVAPPSNEPELSDDELFLEALGDLEVRFKDQYPAEQRIAAPRRMKQLRQGKLTPDASLDLHGLLRHQVAEKMKHFLQKASHQQWQSVLVVTGKGLHSTDGHAVLRDEAERFLNAEAQGWVSEWGRAPRQYGGDGALVVFIKKSTEGKD